MIGSIRVGGPGVFGNPKKIERHKSSIDRLPFGIQKLWNITNYFMGKSTNFQWSIFNVADC